MKYENAWTPTGMVAPRCGVSNEKYVPVWWSIRCVSSPASAYRVTRPPMLNPPTTSRSPPSFSALARRIAAVAAWALVWMAAVRSLQPSRMTSLPRRRSSLTRG